MLKRARKAFTDTAMAQQVLLFGAKACVHHSQGPASATQAVHRIPLWRTDALSQSPTAQDIPLTLNLLLAGKLVGIRSRASLTELDARRYIILEIL